MKVLLISSKYHPEYSGSGFRAHNTYKRLKDKYGLDFEVVCNAINFQGNKKYLHEGINIYRISCPLKKPNVKGILYYVYLAFSFFWELYFITSFLLKNKYDLLHTFGNSWTIGFSTLFFSITKKPVVRELCNEMENPMYPIQFQRYIKKVFLKRNTMIVAISERLAQKARNFDVENIWTRFNPVNTNNFRIDFKNKYKFRNEFTPFNKSDIVLAIVANIIPRKNQFFCLEVLKRLPENYKLLIAGPVKKENRLYLDKLKSYINEKNLINRVFIKEGLILEMNQYISLSDVFLFPSLSEGLGTPVLEAQLCGVPVIANLIEGITDTMIENKVGGFSLKLNPKEWAKKVEEAIKIQSNTLIENSKELSYKCSSDIIDEFYINKLTKLHETNR